MKKTIILLGLIVFIWNGHLIAISHAQGQRGQKSPLSDEARRVWQGEYSPGDLPKWEKRLEKLRWRKKWGGVALCHTAIGGIHYHQGDFDEALTRLNQSLEISRKNGP